ncbi:unnamed protein product [Mytilus edulis]|uniref:Uncharacterized protein n=1 Tax=Mytilus edulis TaxID=6550 RepID=A0A8S3T0B5_MYTED|nr:unnamed protein product [Mytilus edulis]
MAILLLSVFVLLVSTLTVHGATFANAVQKGTVTSHYIHEASGLCASRQHPNMLYTHNDSGDTHRIYAIDGSNGQRKALIWIDGAHSTDWEDIACGPCAGGSGNCVYIADTGGNAGGDANTIYRIREPDYLNGDMHVSIDSTLQFSWDQHDCETVMVDPNGEVYVVSKVSAGHHAKFVHLPKSAWGAHHHVYVNDGVYLSITTNAHDPVGGDISPAGNEILLKTYGRVNYWSVPDRNYAAHITHHPQVLPYHNERQGESVCWDVHGDGYYTLSEGANQPLWYYKRQSPKPVG